MALVSVTVPIADSAVLLAPVSESKVSVTVVRFGAIQSVHAAPAAASDTAMEPACCFSLEVSWWTKKNGKGGISGLNARSSD